MDERMTKAKSEKGQSIVEFAVGLVILIVLLAGIVDAGRALFTYMALREAAQEGALYGSTNPTDTSSIEDRVRNASDLVRDLSSTSPSEPSGGHHASQPETIAVQVDVLGDACTGNGIEVKVSYDQFPITMPFLGTLLGSQFVAISASATDTILAPGCP